MGISVQALRGHPIELRPHAVGTIMTSVGRVRADQALPNGIKYVLVSAHTKMGAANGAILVAESPAHRGQI